MKTFPEKFAEQHARLLRMLPRGEAWRGCIGIGLTVTEDGSVVQCGQDLVLAPNQAVLWHTLVELPERYYSLPRPRCSKSQYVLWASRFHARLRYGMPFLVSDEGYDFRDPLVANAQSRKIWSALSLNMTAAAVIYRAPWHALKKAYADSFGGGDLLAADLEQMAKQAQGNDGRFAEWMPEAYIPFPEAVSRDLVDACLQMPAVGMPNVNLSGPIIRAFIRYLDDGASIVAPCSGTVRHIGVATLSNAGKLRVLRILVDNRPIHVSTNAHLNVVVGTKVRLGQQLGTESVKLPDNWSALSPPQRWHQLLPRVFRNPRASLSIWFERQMLHLDVGKVHLPAAIASLLAAKFAAAEGLWWRLNPALEFFNEGVEACVFPAIRARTWDALAGVLKGEVRYDLHPRLAAHTCLKRRLRRPSHGIATVSDNAD
jgi:hypothetical protein